MSKKPIEVNHADIHWMAKQGSEAREELNQRVNIGNILLQLRLEYMSKFGLKPNVSKTMLANTITESPETEYEVKPNQISIVESGQLDTQALLNILPAWLDFFEIYPESINTQQPDLSVILADLISLTGLTPLTNEDDEDDEPEDP